MERILITAMHAYLLVGTGNFGNAISALSERLQAKVMEYPIVKIEDTRNLNSLIRLSFSEPTLIVSRDIHKAGEEALNAFLKNLEEPQANIYFALTTPTTRKVIKTVVSRCQIINISGADSPVLKKVEVEEFLTMLPGQRLAFFDKIGSRDKAIEFVESLIFCLHENGDLKNMEALLTTLKRLNQNGSVPLQLTNLLINYA